MRADALLPPPPAVTAGKWDARQGAACPPFPLRWFCSWTPLADGRLAGFIAGYEGGNAFMEERFAARLEAGAVVSFIWNGLEHVGAEPTPATVAAEVEALQDLHARCFIAWHDEAAWERGDLKLRDGLERRLTSAGTALWLPPRESAAMSTIAALVHRTGILTRFR